jgi:hypothetical protein
MSIGIIEKQILYDYPSAPIVKFSSSENFDEDDDMMNEQISSQSTLGLSEKQNNTHFLFFVLFNRIFIQSIFT